MGNLTEVERERWKKIRRRVYLPEDVDEYHSSSSVLNEITREGFSDNKAEEARPLKPGYVADLCSDAGIAPCALILGLFYVRRLSRANPNYLRTISPTDLFLTTMVVASKYLQDEGEMEALVNSEWAEIGQRSKSVVDALERDFLAALDWRLFVTLDEYYTFAASLQARIAMTEAGRRGWWSYSDLAALWEGSEVPQTMMNAGKHTAKVASGGVAAYLACLTMLMTAAHLVTTDTPTSAAPAPVSSTAGRTRPPLTLLPRVVVDSNWQEETDLAGLGPLWEWPGTSQELYASVRNDSTSSLERRPPFFFDSSTEPSLAAVRNRSLFSAITSVCDGTCIAYGNRTPPLIPRRHCRRPDPPPDDSAWYGRSLRMSRRRRRMGWPRCRGNHLAGGGGSHADNVKAIETINSTTNSNITDNDNNNELTAATTTTTAKLTTCDAVSTVRQRTVAAVCRERPDWRALPPLSFSSSSLVCSTAG